jgi:hypothetical protein
MIDLEKTFNSFDNDFLEFELVENKLHPRADLCAFLLLDKLIPGTADMVSAGEHDEIWLDTDCDKLAEIATEADILTLVRCGVRYGDGSLAMFV